MSQPVNTDESEVTTMEQMIPVFAGRWGYHPCDFELFLKLRSLHRWYWQTLRDFHRWHRWQRKAEENRRGPEPCYCPLFVQERPWYRPTLQRGETCERIASLHAQAAAYFER
jgi:hypothetical protein